MFTRERLTRWTKSLRENSHRRGVGRLIHRHNEDTFLCCALGELCLVEGLEEVSSYDPYGFANPSKRAFAFPYSGIKDKDAVAICGDLRDEFGSSFGTFSELNMPDLIYDGVSFASAVEANDRRIPWSVIADHFDRHYPCSDEQA